MEEALKLDPELAQVHRLLGEALGQRERWPEAVKQFEAYAALTEEDADAFFLLGQAYIETGELEKGATTFAQGVRADPGFLARHREEIDAAAGDFLQAGKEALEVGDLARATELLDAVAPLVPGQGELYILLGQAHQQAGDLLPAIAAYADAANLSADLRTVYADEIDSLVQQAIAKSEAALDGGDLDTAAQVMEAVVELRPDDPQARFILGNVYNQANQFAQAIEQYQTVIDLEPDSSSAHTNMGVVYYKMGDLETAVEEFKAALQIEPDDAETHYLLGAAYVQMEQLETGQTEFETAIALDEQLAPPYIGLGNVYLLQGEVESAREMAEIAIELSPNSPEAFFLLGQVNIQLGDAAEARAALQQVLSLNPTPHWREQVERMLESLQTE